MDARPEQEEEWIDEAATFRSSQGSGDTYNTAGQVESLRGMQILARVAIFLACMVASHGYRSVTVFHVIASPSPVNSESLSELDSLDPQKRELLEARLMGRVSVRERFHGYLASS